MELLLGPLMLRTGAPGVYPLASPKLVRLPLAPLAPPRPYPRVSFKSARIARRAAEDHQHRERKRKRLVVVFGLVLSYSWYYVCRLSLTYAAPAIVREEGLDLRRLGAILSCGQISIGFSKILSSVLTADLSPSRCLVVGLLLTAGCNVLASLAPGGGGEGATQLVLILAGLWALNGLFQGLGSPSCARIISAWCSAKERGFFWSLWNVSNNLGGALAPLMVGLGAAAGWRGSLLMAGFSAAVVSFLVFLLVHDSPSAAAAAKAAKAAKAKAAAAPAMPGSTEDQLSGSSLFWKGCLLQPGMASLAMANFLIYGLKSALICWLAFYVQSYGHNALSAAPRLSTFECGGLFGSVLSGPLSDRYWHLRGGETGAAGAAGAPLVGCRVQVAMTFVICVLVPSVFTVVFAPGGRIGYPAMFALGLGLYVAQSLCALCGLELVSSRAAGVSQGLLGWSAYTGAAAAGLPLGWLIQSSGWQAWRMLMAGGALLVTALLLPLWRLPSNEQRHAAR